MTLPSFAFLASTPFSFYPGRFQMLALELAERGAHVDYFTGPVAVVNVATRQRWNRETGRVANGTQDDPRNYRKPTGLRVHGSLMPVPLGRFAAVRRCNAAILRARVQWALREVPRPIVAVSFMPEWLERVGADLFDAVLYDVPDEIKLMTTLPPDQAKRAHQYSISHADAVTVTANRPLQDGLRPLLGGVPMVEIGNGVDLAFFRARAEDDVTDLLPGDQPTAGFVGAIHHWVDVALVVRVARLLPDVRFALVGNLDGQSQAAIAATGLPANVKLLGRQPKRRVPSLMRRFNVGLIPFHTGPISETTDPIKVYEYFSVGCPVVATPMPSLVPFASEGLLTVAQSDLDFAGAIQSALVADPQSRAKRKQVADCASWSQRTDELLAVADAALVRRGRTGRL